MMIARRSDAVRRPRANAAMVACAGLLWLVFASGCATYTDRTEAAREFARVGNYDAAVGELS
ncbi:MAG: hypothetical protein QF570_00320, partial [Myxococcota bacterium]|nr:hypothetical protein [Myxococcota bacterium]